MFQEKHIILQRDEIQVLIENLQRREKSEYIFVVWANDCKTFQHI